jgi:hypothetical protein
MNEKLTSYCGLYCKDCIPSNEELFSLIEKIDNLLENLQFEQYAKLKSNYYPKLSQYQTFSETLKEIKLLKCSAPCRNDGGKEECSIRECCITKSYIGCWECSDRQTCNLLTPLKKVHINLSYHHDLIRDHGIANWVQHRKAHYKWQEENKT